MTPAPPTQPAEPARPASPRPRALVAATGLVALEAALIGVLAGYLMVRAIVGAPESVLSAEIAGAIGLTGGAALVFVARGLLRARRWSRAPALVVQLLSLPVAWNLLQSGHPAIGAPLMAAAAGVVILLFTPAVSAALE
ncbi:MAG: hypothetical protein ACRDPK_10675 [Carbonactinosporaceae bacterium]